MKNILIVWTDINEVGIPILDEQHRGIVSIINSLFFFMLHKHGIDILRPTVAMIEQYSKIHFLTEEAMLRRYQYPGYDEHVLHHTALIEKMYSVVKEISRTGDPSELLRFLKSWWMSHINEEDQAYSAYLQERIGEEEAETLPL